ncbi:MAG: DUF523 and DUF1722 domain-containing protein [Candidatus Bathyarchaeota archaeon]|nr:DUF523 and DUF1722 domain-containing protein [Candidatus Bathyarchaeota archaeon]
MRKFVTPTVVVSRCIEIDPCRYNGLKIASYFVKQLIPYVNLIPVCPEVEIGLGTPREALRIVMKEDKMRLIQPKTGLDFTEKMDAFVSSFLESLPEVDGFILKGRSPTSALKDARRYSGPNPGDAIRGKGPGFFGKAVLERFSHLAIEEEGRLRNPNIKSNFLTKLYTLAKFREVKRSKSSKEILKFHSENKLLLRAYNEKEMRILGRIVAQRDQYKIANLITDYEKHLLLALKRAPRCGSQINVLMNSMGYFSKSLSGEEKDFFLKSLDDYKEGVIPLSVLTGIFNSWILRFKDDYLLSQSFFEPYPREFVDIDLMTSYCDGKDYWK